jgi:hypothetical protein
MKTTKLILGLVVGLGFTNLAWAGMDMKCASQENSQCFMMPKSTQDSKANVTWIGPACCYPADNIKADVSSQNSRASLTQVGKADAKKIGTTMTTYSEKGADVRSTEVQVTN